MTKTPLAERDIACLTREHIDAMPILCQGSFQSIMACVEKHEYVIGKIVPITGMENQGCILLTKEKRFSGAIIHQTGIVYIEESQTTNNSGKTGYNLHRYDPSRVQIKETVLEHLKGIRQKIEREGYIVNNGVITATSSSLITVPETEEHTLVISQPGRVYQVPTSRLEQWLGKGQTKSTSTEGQIVGQLRVEIQKIPPFPVTRWTLDYFFAPQGGRTNSVEYQRESEKIQDIITRNIPVGIQLEYIISNNHLNNQANNIDKLYSYR